MLYCREYAMMGISHFTNITFTTSKINANANKIIDIITTFVAQNVFSWCKYMKGILIICNI